MKENTEEYNITTIKNSHDMKTLFDVGNNVTFIYKGDLEFEGTFEDFRNSQSPLIEEILAASYFQR